MTVLLVVGMASLLLPRSLESELVRPVEGARNSLTA